MTIFLNTGCCRAHQQEYGNSIDSLINQTYDNLEIIVINDCSTDRTKAIVNSLIKEDNRIRQITLAKNSGTYVARNIGLKYCTGDFITVHDADDISHPQKIQFQVNSLINDKSLVGSTSVFTEKGRSLRSDFEEIWRRIHLKKYYPLGYKLLKIIGDKAHAVDEFENYHFFRR